MPPKQAPRSQPSILSFCKKELRVSNHDGTVPAITFEPEVNPDPAKSDIKEPVPLPVPESTLTGNGSMAVEDAKRICEDGGEVEYLSIQYPKDVPRVPLGANDIGEYVLRKANGDKISEKEVLQYLTQPWYPPPDYSFPWVFRKVKKRSGEPAASRRPLRSDHLRDGIVYSHVYGGLFCVYCAIFAPDKVGQGSQQAKQLVKEPCRHYGRLYGADAKITRHHATGFHQVALQKAIDFQAIMENRQVGVDVLLHSHTENQLPAPGRALVEWANTNGVTISAGPETFVGSCDNLETADQSGTGIKVEVMEGITYY